MQKCLFAYACLLSAWTAAAVQMIDLEWNPRFSVSIPYEVEISPAKLEHLAGVKSGTGFSVRAQTPEGVRQLPVAALPGKAPGTVILRFPVPKETERLTCRPNFGRLVLADPARVDNLFAGALTETERWQGTPRMSIEPQKDGSLVFAAKSAGAPEATLTVDVPEGLAGAPVRFEMTVANETDESWSNANRLEQLDAEGRVLPESIADRRWTGHMRPPRKESRFLENGRIHPDAKKIRLRIIVSSPVRPFDAYGLPKKNPSEVLSRLRVSRLALRPAAGLPFPQFEDSYFAPGVSGAADDCAIVLGGTDEKAFWYQTRSMASWSDRVQLRKESQIFFPAGAGTVEAWFKSDWKPTLYTDNGREHSRPIPLFQCYQSYRAHECKGGKGAMLSLTYRPEPGTLEFGLKDHLGKSYASTTALKLPTNIWCHLAAQWNPGGMAEVFLDGKKVLSLPIPELVALKLDDPEIAVPNDENGLEFFLGSDWRSARGGDASNPAIPFLQGAADMLRVSTGCRYADDFTPARAFALDADTRALFTFDRTFDGVSGGGIGWIPGTTRSLTVGRVSRILKIGDKTVQYYPAEILPENDPRKVFDVVNYPKLPTPADFEAARRPFTKTAVLKPGETLSFDCPDKVITDYVEIANVSGKPLAYPILLNTGDVDPRSFGDLADTLGIRGLSDRDRVNRVFAFVLHATDYFMNHTAMFQPGSDKPSDVEYQALFMLNGYCGFECGPLNNLAANLFVTVAGCPASQTAGYGHEFEQVFYDGKNHIYDLSAQKFFPSMDNETSVYLEEGANDSGVFQRMGHASEHFIRKSTRGFWTQNPACVAKIGPILNPGERFRVWQVNDGHCNDLITRTKFGVYRGYASPSRPDYTEPCHADTEKMFLQRVERFFPEYLNGFISFEGRPDAANPAFGEVTTNTFCYRVNGGGYPIVHAEYEAIRKDGTRVPLEISTDNGKSFRPLASPADYAVRARYAYLVRVRAPIAEIDSFRASTEIQLNPRIFPGRLKPGANALTLKAVSGDGTRVTVSGRVPVSRITIPEAVSSGTVIGAERLFYAFDSSKRPVLNVHGASAAATVRIHGDVGATLADGKLTLWDAAPGKTRFGAVTIIDNGAEKTLALLVGSGVRLGTAQQMTLSGGAKRLAPDATSPQPRGLLPEGNHNAEIVFPFDPLPAGKYAVLNLNRFASHLPPGKGDGLRLLWPGLKSISGGYARNDACNFKKANYGRPGERANFKWDYPEQPGTSYPYACLRVSDYPAASDVRFRSWRNEDDVEVVAVLVVPDPDADLRGDLIKILCGFNCDPWRMACVD